MRGDNKKESTIVSGKRGREFTTKTKTVSRSKAGKAKRATAARVVLDEGATACRVKKRIGSVLWARQAVASR